jgi:hypothetical protein
MTDHATGFSGSKRWTGKHREFLSGRGTGTRDNETLPGSIGTNSADKIKLVFIHVRLLTSPRRDL